MTIRGIVTAVGLIIGVVATIWGVNAGSNDCNAGSMGWREVCELRGTNGDIHKIYNDEYLDGWRKSMGVK
jgi:hypothetical protein